MPRYKMCVLIFVLLLFIIQPAMAVAPPAPIGATLITTTFNNTTSIPIPTGPATITSTITVSGVDPYLLDVDMTTLLQHTFNDDLDVTLTSPAGTVIIITTDNGDGNNNVFDGTLWDDDAPTPLSEAVFFNLVTATPLVPEGAMGAFIGEDPNGVWTLTITDDLAGDGGILNGWSLDITTTSPTPIPNSATFNNNTVIPIPTGPATITSTITVLGVDPYLLDVNMTTLLQHTFNDDLDVTLTSPAGTVIIITTDNGDGNNNVFDGTLWDDDAPTPLSEAVFFNLVTATPLVPEGAMGAFIGEDPNGVWTLTITDDLAGDGGILNGWSLDIQTLQPLTPAYDSTPAIGAIAMSTTTGTPTTQIITMREIGTGNLTVSSIGIIGDPQISITTNPAPFTIVNDSGATQDVVIQCNSATAGSFNATLSATHNATGSPAEYLITCTVTDVVVITPEITPVITPPIDPPPNATASPNISVFDPAISKIGFLRVGQVGITGEALEWVITVTNTGNIDGTNVTITDTLPSALQVIRVTADNASINGQTVAVTYPTLRVGETVQFSIFTTVISGATVQNTACITATNQNVAECATASAVSQLPATGETPLWRDWLVMIGMLILVATTGIVTRRRIARSS